VTGLLTWDEIIGYSNVDYDLFYNGVKVLAHLISNQYNIYDLDSSLDEGTIYELRV